MVAALWLSFLLAPPLSAVQPKQLVFEQRSAVFLFSPKSPVVRPEGLPLMQSQETQRMNKLEISLQ
jgi:hypothetical protein